MSTITLALAIKAANIKATDLEKSIVDWSKGVATQEKKAASVLDLLVKMDIQPDDLKAPQKGEDDSLFKFIKQAVLKSRGAATVKLLSKPTADLSPADKVKRKYEQQQVGSRMSDLRKALANRLKRDEQGRAPRAPRKQEVIWIEKLNAVADAIAKAEAPDFKQPHAVIETIKKAVNMIHGD